MCLREIKFSPLLSLVVCILLLSGCSSNEKSVISQYSLTLAGESHTWDLTGYEVVITSKKFKAGNGKLNMKNANEYIGDSFHFQTHAVINGEDIIIHSGSTTGTGINLAKKTTGTIEGETLLNKKGDPIQLDDVNEIYMSVEWWGEGQRESMKERIDLHKKGGKGQTFLK